MRKHVLRNVECRAAGTAQVAPKSNTPLMRCQTSDKMVLRVPSFGRPHRLADYIIAVLRFSVRHLAVIDRLELEFEPGLNVLTGETGAGKSILVGAVGLLVGGRASADLVRTGEEPATVEAIFETPDGRRDHRPARSLRAGTQPRARSTARSPPAPRCAISCGGLVDLHGQHEHQLLLDPAAHLDLLDAFAGAGAERADVARRIRALAGVRAERERLLTGEREKASRAEFISFQLAEIDRVAAASRARTRS